jgi:acyl carrier protein
MTRDEFLAGLGELLDSKMPLTGPEELSSFRSWDSLAIIELIAMVDEKSGKTLDPKSIYDCKTVSDLLAVVC